MEPIHNHNPRVCCWNCEHFQRYDSEKRPTHCDGECRANPIPGALYITDFIPDPQDRAEFGHNKETAYYWPHITCGLRMRCASFEATTEKDNPQSPLSFDCQHTAPTVATEWRPWVKPGKKERSCFACNWFEPALCQRKFDTQLDNGCCLFNPPKPRQNHLFEEVLPRAEMGVSPSVRGALALWCSKWSGPRPQIGYTDTDPDPPENMADHYSMWESQRERATWLSALTMARFKAIKRAAEEKARRNAPRLVKIDQVDKTR